MAMRVPATDYEWGRPDAGVTEEEFDKRADLWEGINGRDRFSSKFENTERNQVLDPRGDQRGRPMPRDALFATADNHCEWGPDQYRERIEFGMDGPDSDVAYHGAGLPTRDNLSYPANRNHVGAPLGCPSTTNRPPVSDSEFGITLSEDAIDGDN